MLIQSRRLCAGAVGDDTETSRATTTSSGTGGTGSSLLHVWCTANSQQHLLPHLLYQHIAHRFHHFRSCHTLSPEMTSWVAESAPERHVHVCRQRPEELSDPELDEEEEDGTDTEIRQVPTLQQTPHVDAQPRVVGCRKKKTRTVFSRSQVLQLESTFDAKRYLSSAERSNLAAALRLTETQVRSSDEPRYATRRNKSRYAK